MSNASGEGFTLSYKAPLQDDCRSIIELNTHGLQLKEGRAIEISFTLSTAQVTPGAMLGWGFDFGNTVVLSILTTGSPKYTFFQNRYDLEGGFPFTVGTLANAWSVQKNPDLVPSSDAVVTAGSSVKIVATLKRLEGKICELTVKWDGKLFVSRFDKTGGFALSSIFFRAGERPRAAISDGDSFTISDFHLKELEE